MIGILLAVALAGAGDTPAANNQAELKAANQWVSLIDSQRWDESWNSAGTLFKSQMAQPRWASIIGPVRQPLGPVSSRALKTVTRTTSLPGAPDGEYELVQFQTRFANKADAIETVVLAHESSGWKVDGYFIR